jgi:glycosyltransferase involved in cell wall biosynthesis
VRVLLVEPWLTGSHQAWAEGYAARSGHEVHVVAHDGAYWRWRLRGGAVTLAERAADVVAEHGRPDVVLASSMLDVPAFCGHARAWMGETPVALYLHETQPARAALTGEDVDDDIAYRNWASMVAADHVFVNSAFHRAALFDALPALLARPPDERHDHLLDAVRARSTLLPVGVDVGAVRARRGPADDDGAPIVLWSHRWDHDKAPELFFRALRRLDHEGLAFRVALAGANARLDPREFIEAEERFGARLVQAGHLPRADYVDLLGRSAVVVSTAVHEFFGVAMVEAMAAGAVPLLPRSLSYPEIVPDAFHDAVLYDAYGDMVRRLRTVLEDLGGARTAVEGLAASMDRFDWSVLAPAYDAALADVAAGRTPVDVPLTAPC